MPGRSGKRVGRSGTECPSFAFTRGLGGTFLCYAYLVRKTIIETVKRPHRLSFGLWGRCSPFFRALAADLCQFQSINAEHQHRNLFNGCIPVAADLPGADVLLLCNLFHSAGNSIEIQASDDAIAALGSIVAALLTVHPVQV